MIETIKRLIHKIAGQTGVRVVQGGAVLGASSAVENGLRLARNLVLTRLILPEALGLMALVLIFTNFFESVSSVGVKEAVIQSPHAEKKTFLNAVWWLSLVRALGLYAIAYFGAPLAGKFYASPSLPGLIRVAFLASIANGFFSPRGYLAIKQMRYLQWSLISLGAGASGIVVTVLMVLKLRNAWGLVFGYVAEAAIRTILSFVLCPFMPGLEFDKHHSSALMHFSKGMAGLPIMTMIYSQADSFVVGKLFSQHVMGLYAMASALAKGPLMLIGNNSMSLLLPLLTEAREQRARFNRIVLGSNNALLLAGLLIVGAAWIFGDLILGVAYGPLYSAVAGPFAILITSNVAMMVRAPVVCAYLALGLSARHRGYSLALTIIVVALIWPMTRFFGLAGAAATPLIAVVITHVLRLFDLRKVAGTPVRAYFDGCVQVALLISPVLIVATLVRMGASLSLPLMAAGIVLLLVCVAGGWALGGMRQPLRFLHRRLTCLLRGCEE
jgi:O-antigen/teichoic acid export membrane protein